MKRYLRLRNFVVMSAALLPACGGITGPVGGDLGGEGGAGGSDASADASPGDGSSSDAPGVDSSVDAPGADSSIDSGGASDTGVHPDSASGHDTGVGPDTGGSATFACGIATCKAHTQYCELFAGGPLLPDGGSGAHGTCHALPVACGTTPTCACLKTSVATCGGSGSCTDNDGELTETCLLP